MRVTFVTGNKGKFEEVRARLARDGVTVEQRDLKPVEIQADTLDAVATAKLAAIDVEGPVFIDDAGLFIDALNGFPGVYSAYVLQTIGLDGVLALLAGRADGERAARFEAVIAYRAERGGAVRLFRGAVRGRIAPAARSGGHGFGFDPIFVPDGRQETFAELPLEVKNTLSHRGRAVDALAAHFSSTAG